MHYVPLRGSKYEARTGPARPSGRAKATLKILPIEQIIDIREEPQLSPVIAQRQRIAGTQISLRESFESKPAAHKRPGIENRSEVIARR